MNDSYTAKIDDDLTFVMRIRKLGYIVVKRVFDIVCSIIGCLMLIPLTILIKIVYMLNKDFSSIFYSQKRIGKDGKEFKLYKFRSMVNNSKEILDEMLKNPEYKKEWEENQKFENDPRITKLGNILRKTSLDELPQFINILKNDMSLIGPRPLIPGELEAHGGSQKIYGQAKPGITSWWACNGRSLTTYKERLELEYYYIKNQSLKLDIKCIFATIKAVICRDGAK